MARFRFLLAASLALGIAAPAHAQFWGAPSAPPQAPAVRSAPAKPAAPAARAQPAGPPPPPVQDQPAPYDPDLQRLSEILGALHFLRGICNSNEGQKWRNEAQALIDAEAPTGDRHDEMVASFNRGYRGFQAELPDLHAGGRRRHPPLSAGGRQDRPRHHRPVTAELTGASEIMLQPKPAPRH